MNLKGKTIVGIIVGIVVIMAFVIYFTFTYLQNEDMIDEGAPFDQVIEHRLLS
ncbi:hypothetical protein ABID56_002234 [Alkalibacillus flavidus]|uniref:Uncharacterized protein n=1 Tax=Alkalibacillus flavidus TaxID=546021 RepID=A0ABV2KWZ5_9BACI